MPSSSAERLFERLKQTRHGWSHDDLVRVLKEFGFEELRETRHGTLFEHPSQPEGTTVIIPRHRKLKAWVARDVKAAIELVLRSEGGSRP